MVDKSYRRMRMPSELEQPQLSADLEWMLSSSQVSNEFILETLVRGQYAYLYRLALILSGDEDAAKSAVQVTIESAIRNRQRYRSETRAEIWLFQLLLEARRSDNTANGGWGRKRASFRDAQGLIQFRSEKDLWEALDRFGYRTRLLICLYYQYELDATEIAQVLGTDEQDIQTQLGEARRWLRLSRPEGISDGDAAEAWVRSSLDRRWPHRDLDEVEQGERIQVYLRLIEQGDLRKKRVLMIQQMFSTLVIIALVGLAGWMSNRILRMRPLAATRGASITSATPATPTGTISPTQLSQPTSFATLAPTLPLLNLSTSTEEIRQRIFISRSLWKHVWVDALLIRYGPPGYVGPAQVYRNQMWISNPTPDDPDERHLVISGLVYDDPIYALYTEGTDVYTVDLHNSMQYSYPRGNANPIYELASPVHVGMYGYDQRGMLDGSYLSDMIFSAGLVSEFSNLEIIEKNQYLDREILILTNQLENGITEQLMVDTQTGMVLNWLGYLTDDPDTALAEIIVLNLDFEAPFPDNLITSTFFWRQPVTWVDRGEFIQLEPFSIRELSAGFPEIGIRTSRPRITQHIPPPTGYDPSNSCLTFQWPEGTGFGRDESYMAEIFADGYYLGETQLSDPWQILCERSASGSLIACLEPPQGLRSRLYALSKLSWFGLSKPSEKHDVFPDVRVMSSDFAFSPDNRYLAFWACLENGAGCGVFFHDTQTLENRMITPLEDGGTFFVWSPDSRYLAFVGAGPNLQYASSLLVVDVATGEILAEGAFLWPELSLPVDSPVREWGVKFPPAQGEFNACNPTPK